MQAYGKAAPVIKGAADTASPYVKSALSTAKSVATPALKALEPTLKVLAARSQNPPQSLS